MTALALVETGCVVCGSTAASPEARGPDFEHETVPGEFSFVRCDGCGHLYLRPRPSTADLGAIYPADYYAYASDGPAFAAGLRGMREARKVRLFRRAIGEGPRRVLDLGCGNGRLLSLLRAHGAPAWELVGIDFGEGAVEQCRARGFRARATRVEDFTEEDGTFDAVLMIQILEHLEDPRRTLARVRALLRPGGVLILETPNVGGLDYRLFRGRWWAPYHFPRHWNLFTTTSLGRLLRETGFDVARSEHLINTSSWIVSLHNWLADRGAPRWLIRLFHFQNAFLLPPFVAIDLVRKRLGLATSDQRAIARRAG